jgi:protein-S-isoprenylcysteine O-methyltransferase Ste14
MLMVIRSDSKRTRKGSRLRLRLTRLLAVCILFTFAVGAAYWGVQYPVVEKSLFVAGITLVGFGASGRAWATSYISGNKSKELVTTGPYSLCRNPLYFFSMIMGVGIGFCTETLTMPAVIGIVLAVLYFFQIRQEEVHLADSFGGEYKSYIVSTPRFFPSFRHYVEPEQICISPRLMKRGLFGIGFLLILVGVLELFEGLHQSGWLPVLFHIY